MDAAVVVTATAAPALGSDATGKCPNSPMQMRRGAAVAPAVDKIEKRNAVKSDEDPSPIADADEKEFTSDDAAVGDGGASNGGSENDSLGAAKSVQPSEQQELKTGDSITPVSTVLVINRASICR